MEVEISWNIDKGLVMLLDGDRVDYEDKFKRKHPSPNMAPAGTCYFARPIGSDIYSNIAIADLSYIFAWYKTVNDLGISFGKITLYNHTQH